MTNPIGQRGRGARDGGRHSRRRRGEGWGHPGGTPVLLLALILMVTPLVPGSVTLVGQERIDERRPLARDGHLRLQAVSHTVRVEAWDQDEVHLTGTIDGRTQRLEVSGDQRSLSIEIRHDRDARGEHTGTLQLRVPGGAALSIGTVNGDLSLEGADGGSVNASPVNGSIRMDGSPETAALQAVNGAIEFEGSTNALQLNMVSGDARVRGAPRRVDVHSVSGRIEIQTDGAMEWIRANTVAGAVPRSNTLRFRVDDGSAQVRLSSFGGSTTVEPAR